MYDHQAIQLVKKYQKWRRGQIESKDFTDSPRSIGEALDMVIELSEEYLKLKKTNANKLDTAEKRNIFNEGYSLGLKAGKRKIKEK